VQKTSATRNKQWALLPQIQTLLQLILIPTTDSNSNEVLNDDETDEIQSIGSTVSTSEVEEIFLQYDSGGASDSDE
jgi:hypothetical protein